jgi:hypothetical protein
MAIPLWEREGAPDQGEQVSRRDSLFGETCGEQGLLLQCSVRSIGRCQKIGGN